MTTSISSVSTAQSTTQSTRGSASISTLDSNSFLKMLVAELQYQDPSKPMDSAQLVDQLSAMSQVEQATKTNSTLSAILDQISVGQSAALIGRTATSADGTQSGVVQAIRLTESGPMAVLSTGGELQLGPGVTLSA